MPIENRNLKHGDRLVARYHKQTYHCEVQYVAEQGKGGKFLYRLEDGRVFKSPSAAGMAITGKSCNGWAFWSLETTTDAISTETSHIEANASDSEPIAPTTHAVEAEDAPAPAELATASKPFSRTPNQRGVPEGQTRWYCPACKKSFVTAGTEPPAACPAGHNPS
jgi:hypothetical protein